MLPQRSPAPSILPSCFGPLHGFEPRRCKVCPVQERCAENAAFWNDTVSLTQAVRQAEDKLDEGVKSDDVATLYMALCRKHYGRNFNAKAERYLRKGQGYDFLIRAKAICDSEGIDLDLWITACMVRNFEFARKSKWGFQPYMLIGDSARMDYNAYVRRANRYKHVTVDAVGSRTHARDRSVLVDDEQEVGQVFVTSWISGERINWLEAADGLDLSAAWREHRGGPDLWRYVRLQAAVMVTGQFNSSLPDWIGVREFSWGALAELLCRIIPQPQREFVNTADVPGLLWRRI